MLERPYKSVSPTCAGLERAGKIQGLFQIPFETAPNPMFAVAICVLIARSTGPFHPNHPIFLYNWTVSSSSSTPSSSCMKCSSCR